MKKITQHNYEAFALDYLENRLNPTDRQAFEAFLEAHPRIKEELSCWGEIQTLEFEGYPYDEKTALKKEALESEPISAENEGPYFVAYHEGDLSSGSKQQVLDFVETHERQAEFSYFKQIRFSPEAKLPISLKRHLKKTTPLFLIYRTLGMAASVALLMGIFWFFSQHKSTYQPRITTLTINSSSESLITETLTARLPVSTKLKIPKNPSILAKSVLESESSQAFQKTEYNDRTRVDLQSQRMGDSKIQLRQIEPTSPGLAMPHEARAYFQETLFKFKMPSFRRKESTPKSAESDPTVIARARRPEFLKPNEETNEIINVGALKVYKKSAAPIKTQKSTFP